MVGCRSTGIVDVTLADTRLVEHYRNIDAATWQSKNCCCIYLGHQFPVDARRNLSRDFDKGGASRSDGVTRLDDELLVPAKPFGFLAAALNEYEPARPEVYRSRVRPDPRRSLLARVSFRGESLLRGEPVRGA